MPLGGTLTAPPRLLANRGFFPLDADRVEAWDVLHAKRLWSTPVAATERPAAAEGLVFVSTADGIQALREADASVAWQQPLSERLAAPLVSDHGWLIAITQSGTVSAMRAADGSVVWSRSLDAPASAPPALGADRLYIATVDQRLLAVQLETGEPVWSRALGGTVETVAARAERVYAGSTDNFLYCLRARSGQIDWRWRTGGDLIGPLHLDDGRIYIASLDTTLRALDRQSGAQRWLRAVPLRPSTGPVRVGDDLILSGLSPTLRAYAAANGASRGEMDAPGEPAAPVHVTEMDGQITLIVLTRDVARGTMMTALRPRRSAASEERDD